MIVYECEDTFCLIKQNDHADVSGQLFDQLRKELTGEQRYNSVRKAVYEHDRAWITMDEVPIWHDGLRTPYTFIDFPYLLNYRAIKKGYLLQQKRILMQVYYALCTIWMLSEWHNHPKLRNISSKRKKDFLNFRKRSIF